MYIDMICFIKFRRAVTRIFEPSPARLAVSSRALSSPGGRVRRRGTPPTKTAGGDNDLNTHKSRRGEGGDGREGRGGREEFTYRNILAAEAEHRVRLQAKPAS